MMHPTAPQSFAEVGPRERIHAIPEFTFKPRETQVLTLDTDAIGPVRCPGARFRLEFIVLPSHTGYRFSLGLVADDDVGQVKLAKTYPIHGASLSEMSLAIPLHLNVKRRVDIYVRRQAIRPWYRFLGEKYDPSKHLLINAVRPEVKEPETVTLSGALRLVMAPPNGWN